MAPGAAFTLARAAMLGYLSASAFGLGELGRDAPIAAIEVSPHGRLLRFDSKAAFALMGGKNSAVRDKTAKCLPLFREIYPVSKRIRVKEQMEIGSIEVSGASLIRRWYNSASEAVLCSMKIPDHREPKQRRRPADRTLAYRLATGMAGCPTRM
jgi:hypothetical protein